MCCTLSKRRWKVARARARARVHFSCGFFLLCVGVLRVSAVCVGLLAGVGGEVPACAVAAVTSSCVFSNLFCVKARTGAQPSSSCTLLLCRIRTVARIPSAMAGEYFSTFSCLFSFMR